MTARGLVRAWRYGLSGVKVSASTEFESSRGMEIQRGCCIDGGVRLVGGEEGRGHLTIRENVVLRMGCYISARRGRVVIGANGYLGHGCWVGGRGETNIGDWFLCAPKVVIISSNHDYRNTRIPYALQDELAGVINIGNNVWIGANSVILPGAIIGGSAVVAAGSVVKGEVAPETMVAGVPATFRRKLDDSDDAGPLRPI